MNTKLVSSNIVCLFFGTLIKLPYRSLLDLQVTLSGVKSTQSMAMLLSDTFCDMIRFEYSFMRILLSVAFLSVRLAHVKNSKLVKKKIMKFELTKALRL